MCIQTQWIPWCKYAWTRPFNSARFFLKTPTTHSTAYLFHDHCDQIWRNFSTLCKCLQVFCKCLQVFGKCLMVYFLFCKILGILWRICYIIGLIFIVVNGPILKNNITIWSHCSRHKMTFEVCFLKKSKCRHRVLLVFPLQNLTYFKPLLVSLTQCKIE